MSESGDLGKDKSAPQEFHSNYRILFNLNPLPMWVYDVETYQILNVNDAAVRHYGFEKEEFLTLTIKDLRPEEEIKILQQAVEKVRNSTQNFSHGTYKHRKKNGDLMDVQIWGTTVFLDTRKAELILSVDITATLQAEREIIASNKKLKDAQSIARLGYWSRSLTDDVS